MYINYSFDLLTTGQKLYWQISISAKGFPRCLKITEKVSLIIASEASYVYILSGQKFIKNAKNGRFWRLFET